MTAYVAQGDSRVPPANRLGFSLLEMLIALAIVGMLLAIVVPGVQSVRMTARRANCQNNLHQFGVAIAEFAETNARFPTATLPSSPYMRLLPYFEQQALLDQLRRKFANPREPIEISWYIESYGCPDDARVHQLMEAHGDASYFFNTGTIFRGYDTNGFRKSSRIDTRVNEIEDGMSQTVAMSERLVNDAFDTNEQEPGRDFWWTEVRYKQKGEEPLAVEQCRNHRTTQLPRYGNANARSFNAGFATYDHLLTPNRPACHNGPEDFEADIDWFIIPATSHHAGGVNALVADGSVHFVNNSIDGGVWSALGTRNGHESVGTPF